ncbi:MULTISPECIES: prepilin-type N-terminal cleavage/methylation domain-containing protein [Thermomonas]|jgi:general secretion pathway protein I|uniref:Prepilin-type N-terminal cleavage/methylation domain-containing protein n=1 Tax=Thermomonas beijingensis TaxID=2872701 RepID=A0ABS7TEY4_9GAMM|nr:MULTISPECIES: prepilin-type N-terminal cleavage/methylation domain-containing protein [Thermomonas]MBS0460073.1 prepilin-type N-terminal cleavage/methylation domain-containing protein [Pseudomonadota bacterium]MDE2381327.1 prepilin-type N-terminal cleavage/methylation domain-containing protein [Xanthomonadaceae bacterium]MBZ4186403.1 prepilin-type N-terminal cleavage/methylation domain-containing protein [Thermomonas beijingensis]HOC11834.1 prepilin-type N-terminal cleavage/methylation domai
MRRAQAGFTLLEAIVALVVFTMGALALYGWLSTNIITLDRIRARQQLELTMHSALDLIRRTNPMDTPVGERQVGDLKVSWISALLEPAKPNVVQSGRPGIFVVGLYEVSVRVSRNGQLLQTFQVRQVGWKQVMATPVDM